MNELILDLDIDNQADAGTMILSGPETDSESDVPENIETEEQYPESIYIHCPEEEFGEVFNNNSLIFI